jgi:hypothetical protein
MHSRTPHVLIGRQPQAARLYEADGAIRFARVLHTEIREHPPQPLPERPTAPEGGGARERRQQEGQAQVGVGPDVPASLANAAEDQSPDALEVRQAKGSPHRHRAEDEVLIAESR